MPAWYKSSDAGKEVWELAEQLRRETGYRDRANLAHVRLYSETVARQYYRRVVDRGADIAGALAGIAAKPRLQLNVIRSVIDSAHAVITRSRPRVSFLTTGGSYERQQTAKSWTKFCDAVFHAQSTHALAQRAFKHAAIFGTGLIAVEWDGREIRHSLVPISEILVDESEAYVGQPRTMIRERLVDRGVLAALYPQHRRAIEKAATERTVQPSAVSDLVLVRTAWHLRSGPDATDGRKIVRIDQQTLEDEDWDLDYHPIAECRWSREPLGWYGSGIAQELTGIQWEINQCLQVIQNNYWLGSSLKVLCERGSRVTAAQFNNSLRGTVIDYTGTPPQWITTPSVDPGLTEHLRWLVQEAYQITGVPELAARGEKPAGLNSGRAQLVYQETTSQRFLPVQRDYEALFVQLARLTVETARRVGDPVRALFPGRGELEEIILAGPDDEDLDDYVIQAFPTSILPFEPAGRLEMIEQLRAAGYIDPPTAKRLLDFPDLESENASENASSEYLDASISRMVRTGEYIAPTPDMDLQMALRRVTAWILRAQTDAMPDDRLALLTDYQANVLELIKMAAPPPPEQPIPAPPVSPPGA